MTGRARCERLALVGLFAVAVSSASAGSLGSRSKAAGVPACVEATELMRRDHMELLWHQRDRTVRQGLRTPQFSLTGCVDCHADKDDSGAFVPVDADGQFCQSCHASAAVSLDCFECHASVPDEAQSSAANAAFGYGLIGAFADARANALSSGTIQRDR